MANQKNILLQISRDNQIYDLFVKTTSHNVVVDKATGETLKQRLAKIAKQLGSTDLSVTEQVQEVKDQIKEIIGAAPEALDSIHEIADWIETHTADFDALKEVADGMEEAIAEVIGDIGEFETVAEYVEAKIEASQAAQETALATAMAAERLRAQEVVNKNIEDIAANKKAIEDEVTRATEAEEDLDQKIKDLDQKIEDLIVVFENADEYDPEKVKKFACIFLDDDPIEAASEADLVEAAAQTENKNVVLTANISVANSIDLSGLNIESDGYEIVAASQDVVITL